MDPDKAVQNVPSEYKHLEFQLLKFFFLHAECFGESKREVKRGAGSFAGDDAPVVFRPRTRVFESGSHLFRAGISRDAPSGGDARFMQHNRRGADRGKNFAFRMKFAEQFDHVRIVPQIGGSRESSGEKHGVEEIRVQFFQRASRFDPESVGAGDRFRDGSRMNDFTVSTAFVRKNLISCAGSFWSESFWLSEDCFWELKLEKSFGHLSFCAWLSARSTLEEDGQWFNALSRTSDGTSLALGVSTALRF